MLALAQLLHVLLYLDAATHSTRFLSYGVRAWVGNLAYAASTALILPALMSTRIDRGRFLRVLDTLLVVLFGVVLMFTLGSGPVAGDGSRRIWAEILALALLSGLALVTFFSQANIDLRRFASVAGRMIWVDLVTSLLVNCVGLRWFPDAPNAVLAPIAALPSLMLCYWTIKVPVTPASKWFTLDRIVIDSLQPSVLAMSSVMLTLFAFGRRPLLVGVLIVFVVLLYIVRTQLFYSRLFREGHRLRTQTEHLHKLATRDPLTGIANRRWFEETLMKALEERSAYPCSLLMVDTDQFKEINDRRGHPAGDAVLCMIADVLQRICNGTDRSCVARLGGDEFAVLLPSTSRELALRCAEFIRSGVEELGATRGYGVTVSIGISTLDTHGSRSELLQAADEALYRAKGRGRNTAQV